MIELQLGKQAYEPDPRTLKMANYLVPDVHVPATWDFDKHRRAFPVNTWGNVEWGDCVIGGEANQVLRLERIEQRRTLPLTDQDAIDRYKLLSGAQTAGDSKDRGLQVIDAMRDWRNVGWTVDGHTYQISAYGELDPGDGAQLRMSNYLLHGIHLGLWLPRAARDMVESRVWDYNGETGASWKPGSWGGHLVYSKAFDPTTLEIFSWGMKMRVTNSFIEKYCDEAWAVVDSLDSWRTKQTVDVSALESQLRQISSHVNE